MTDPILIRSVTPEDQPAWTQMWAAYCAFYGETIPAQVTSHAWRGLTAAEGAIRGLIAERNGVAVGFANYVLHPYTWSDRPACYLEDLYVREAARGRGVGRALIRALIDRGETEGWGRIYWMTQEGNAAARKLYDSFTARDAFVRYLIPLSRRRGGTASEGD